eukprot:7391829-Prymnesium_polylepis.2
MSPLMRAPRRFIGSFSSTYSCLRKPARIVPAESRLSGCSAYSAIKRSKMETPAIERVECSLSSSCAASALSRRATACLSTRSLSRSANATKDCRRPCGFTSVARVVLGFARRVLPSVVGVSGCCAAASCAACAASCICGSASGVSVARSSVGTPGRGACAPSSSLESAAAPAPTPASRRCSSASSISESGRGADPGCCSSTAGVSLIGDGGGRSGGGARAPSSSLESKKCAGGGSSAAAPSSLESPAPPIEAESGGAPDDAAGGADASLIGEPSDLRSSLGAKSARLITRLGLRLLLRKPLECAVNEHAHVERLSAARPLHGLGAPRFLRAGGLATRAAARDAERLIVPRSTLLSSESKGGEGEAQCEAGATCCSNNSCSGDTWRPAGPSLGRACISFLLLAWVKFWRFLGAMRTPYRSRPRYPLAVRSNTPSQRSTHTLGMRDGCASCGHRAATEGGRGRGRLGMSARRARTQLATSVASREHTYWQGSFASVLCTCASSADAEWARRGGVVPSLKRRPLMPLDLNECAQASAACQPTPRARPTAITAMPASKVQLWAVFGSKHASGRD